MPYRRPYRQLSHVGQQHARAHARRATCGRFVSAELDPARVPPGYRAVLNRARAAEALQALPGLELLYANGRRTRLAVYGALLAHLGDDGLIEASHRVLAQWVSEHDGPVSRSTVGGHVRAIIAAGGLHLVGAGSSAQVNGGERDLAPTYAVLTLADVLLPGELAAVQRLAQELADDAGEAVDELRHHPEGRSRTRRAELSHPRTDGSFSCSTHIPERVEHPEHFAPRSAGERRRAVLWLAAACGWRADEHAARELVTVCAPFFAAGWSPRAVLRAWWFQPDGEPFRGPLPEPQQRDAARPARVRSLWAVLTWRLGHWRGLDRQPLAPPVPAETPRRGRPRRRPEPTPAALPAPTRPPAHAAAMAAALGLRIGAARQPREDPAVPESFANPYLACAQCHHRVVWRDVSRNMPCGHQASFESCCPSWSPVDGCRCVVQPGERGHGVPVLLPLPTPRCIRSGCPRMGYAVSGGRFRCPDEHANVLPMGPVT